MHRSIAVRAACPGTSNGNFTVAAGGGYAAAHEAAQPRYASNI